MASPLVSIIIPVYNVEEFIGDCLKSVLKQTYRPLEIILIDDRGTDKSMEIATHIVDEFKEDNLYFSIFRHEKNQGLSAARNTGTHYAKGDYLMYLDSDDQITPTMVEKSMIAVLSCNADFSICDFFSDAQNVNRGGHLRCKEHYLNGMDALKAFNKGLIGVSAWGKIVKRSFLRDNSIGFLPGIINEDEPWFFKMLLYARNIAIVQGALYYYRYNQNSIMSNARMDKSISSNKLILDEYLRIINSNNNFKDNKDIYLAYMRMLVLYFTRLIEGCRILPNINDFRYEAAFWRTFSSTIPIYYRLWNVCAFLPKCLQRLYLSIIINLQKYR